MRGAIAREYVGIAGAAGPLVFVEGVSGVSFGETVEVVTPAGERRRGQVLEVDEDRAVVEVFQGTRDLSSSTTRVRFLGHPLLVPVSLELGEALAERILDELGDVG